MRCPNCHTNNLSRITNSRESPDGELRWRRHLCENCGGRFTTYEITAAEYSKIQAIDINVTEFDNVIASLRSIKVQFSETQRNGHRKD